MTENDERLIEEARAVSVYNWPSIAALTEKADTQEARDRLAEIQRMKHHLEEAKSGMI